MKKQLTIESVSDIKSGSNASGTWTLSKVIVAEQDIKDFTTFNGSKYQDLVGQTVDVDVTERVNGKFRNWSESQKQSRADEKHEEIMKGLRENYKMLKQILDRVDKDTIF